MPASLHPDDLLRFAGALLAILSLILAARIALPETLRLRPPRRTPRCPGGFKRLLILPLRDHCWYDLSRVPPAPDRSIRCPECGRRNTPRRQRRRRHHWRRALLASPLLLLAYALYATPRIQSHGWPGAIPTTALILAMPALHHILPAHADWATADPRLTTIYEETARRLREPSMWNWQRSLAIELVPMDDKAWEMDPRLEGRFGFVRAMSHKRADPCLAALWRSLCDDRLSRAQTRRLLARTFQLRPSLRELLADTRPAWNGTSDVRAYLNSSAGVFWDRRSATAIRLRVAGAASWQGPFFSMTDWTGVLELCELIATAPPVGESIDLEAQVLFGVYAVPTDSRYQHYDPILQGQWVAWEGTVRSIAIEERPDLRLTPVDNPADDPNLRAWLGRCQVMFLEDGGIALEWPDTASHPSTTACDYAFSARFEIIHQGRVIAQGRATDTLPEPGSLIWGENFIGRAIHADWVDDRPSTPPQDGLSVRFVGDSEDVWDLVTYPAYWSGDLTVPVKVSVRAHSRYYEIDRRTP